MFALFAIADKFELAHLRDYWQRTLVDTSRNFTVYENGMLQHSYDVFRAGTVATTKMERTLDFTKRCYDCENTGIKDVRNGLTLSLSKCAWKCADGKSLLLHMLEGTMLEKPQLALDLVPLLAEQKANQPVLELLKYKAMSELLSDDPKIMIGLVNSLSFEASPTIATSDVYKTGMAGFGYGSWSFSASSTPRELFSFLNITDPSVGKQKRKGVPRV